MLNYLTRLSTTLLLFLTLAFPAYAQPHHGESSHHEDSSHHHGPKRWVIEDVLASDDSSPFAIGHRGFGVNLGENPDKPIENTARSVRKAFRAGVQIVEVDVVMTKDHQAVALHDDFLADYTCVNQQRMMIVLVAR